MGLFQFCRMPFGLTGAPSTFQRMMNKIFRGLPFVTVYVDDVLVHSATAAPILAYPQFHQHASQFVLQTDASATGLGAVLEQDGHVIAYASRTLNKAEQQYSVIQKECLAAVYAMKQFRHYTGPKVKFPIRPLV